MLLQLPNKTMIYKIKYWLTNIKKKCVLLHIYWELSFELFTS